MKTECVLPEYLANENENSNDKNLCKDPVDNSPYCINGGICDVANNQPHCNYKNYMDCDEI